MSRLKRLVNIVIAIFGIGLCFYDATKGNGLVITFIILAFLIVHSIFVSDHVMEISIIIIAGLIGALAECINVLAGFYQYVAADEQLKFLPVWIILIWFVVGTTARNAFGRLSDKVHLTLLASILFALSIYSAGVKTGALLFSAHDIKTVGLSMLSWAIAFSLIIIFSNKYFQIKED